MLRGGADGAGAEHDVAEAVRIGQVEHRGLAAGHALEWLVQRQRHRVALNACGAGHDPAVGADLLATTVNTAVESWDQASSAAAIEGHLLEFFARKLRWPEDPHSRTRGVFTSGGTQSNLQALYIAREKALGAQGVQGLSQLRLYTSSHAHYSVLRAAHLLGLADTAVITIESDAEHRLDAADLARRIAADVADGYTPMAVVATAGATDRGTIDPLESIAKVCRHAGVHLHVDAAYGGILLLSPTQRHRLRGMDEIGRAHV